MIKFRFLKCKNALKLVGDLILIHLKVVAIMTILNFIYTQVFMEGGTLKESFLEMYWTALVATILLISSSDRS